MPDGVGEHRPPVAFTIAFSCGLTTVKGPTSDWIGPLSVAGLICRLGGGGSTNGPSAITLLTIAATVPCSGSLVLIDVVVAEVPDRGLHRRGAVVLVPSAGWAGTAG